MKYQFYILFILLGLLFFESSAQLSSSEKRILKEANMHFDNKDFKSALPLFLNIDSVYFDYVVKYRIGACYLNTDFEKLKGLPFLEEVGRNKLLQVPVDVYYDLGILYHYIYRFDEAIANFNQYISIENKKRSININKIGMAKRMIKICNNALEITAISYNVEIGIVNSMINSMASEYCPIISADEKTLVYIRTKQNTKTLESSTEILLSRKTEEGYWEKAKPLSIDYENRSNESTVTLAGLSNDGHSIFLNIGIGLNQDIYSGIIYGNKITEITKLSKDINTPYYEGKISLSPDGTELYFVSDRPGGFGKTDIYKSKLNRRGNWGPAENLGDSINTKYNERSPFLHPDNVTLYFSSEGHKTIGGSDIFKSTITNGQWSTPENQGYINSTKDDLYFVLNANGQVGYFSSSKNNIYDRSNIYKVNFKDPIPLTLLKGKVTAGNPPVPIEAEISVYDNESGEQIKYVYNSNQANGKYLMIFPPAKNYDILISGKDYLPQLINVYIPYQTYFYELYQEVHLHPINIQDNIVGERVSVNNTFYDLYKTKTADSILLDDIPKQANYYDHLLELVEKIIETTDTLRINYTGQGNKNEFKYSETDQLLNLIDEAIETSDPVTLSILDANAKQNEKIRSSYFYTNGDKNQSLASHIIGSDTLYTAPAINTKEKNTLADKSASQRLKHNTELIKIRNSHYTERNYIHKFTIYFDSDSEKISEKYTKELHEIIRILVDNEGIGAEVYGYADTKGEKNYNMSLSKQRARNVLEYMLNYRINKKKLITKGFGEIENPNEEETESLNRKVEINIFELRTE